MNYEVITSEEKVVAGIEARTNNNSPDMGMVIGGLWNHFYQDGIYESIPNKITQKALAEFWQELWKMDLPRAYQCDFEEYQNDSMEECEIHIYIGLK